MQLEIFKAFVIHIFRVVAVFESFIDTLRGCSLTKYLVTNFDFLVLPPPSGQVFLEFLCVDAGMA